MKHMQLVIITIALGFLSAYAMAQRTLEHQAIVDAPIADVWDAWTTNEGFTSWAVAKADIDLHVGGDMRTSYNAKSTLQDEHTIINRILSFEPQRMLSIKNIQAPGGFKNAELFQNTWSVIYFTPIVPDRTHIRIIGMGYGEGPEWDDIYSKFKAGNQWTIDSLCKKFAAGDHDKAARADDANAVFEALKQMVGGNWIHENTQADGTVIRARTLMELGPTGNSVIGKGWLGDANGMMFHGTTQIWREPAAKKDDAPGPIRFQNINERGTVARGAIHLIKPNQLHWDWVATDLSGAITRYQITTTLEGPDHYRFVLTLPADAANGDDKAKELVNILYQRVQEVPAVFTKMKESD